MSTSLQTIKLGAPSSIKGGASPNAALTVQVMDNCSELELKDTALGKCTNNGALKQAAVLIAQKQSEDVSTFTWYTPRTEEGIKVTLVGTGTDAVTTADINALYNELDNYTSDSSITGSLSTTGTYQSVIDALKEKFPNLTITAEKFYIKFADSEVESICATNWGDGDEITVEQAAAVKTLNQKFRGNTTITSFDEFNNFISCISVENWGFYGDTALASITLPSSIRSLGIYAFNSCTSLTSITFDYDGWITSNSAAFYGCKLIESLGIQKIKLETNATEVFQDCYNLKYLPKIDFSDDTTLFGMFASCYSLTELPDIYAPNCVNINYFLNRNSTSSKFTLTKVGNITLGAVNTSTNSLCANVPSLEEVGDCDFSKCTTVSGFFKGCTSLKTIKSLKVSSSCTNTSTMFMNCTSITDWSFLSCDFSNIINADSMFYNCSSSTDFSFLNETEDYGKLVYNGCMFYNCKNLSISDLRTFSKTVNVLMMQCLYGCVGLSGAICFEKVTIFGLENSTVGSYSAIGNCTNLTAVFLPKVTKALAVSSRSMLYDFGDNIVDIRTHIHANTLVVRADTPPTLKVSDSFTGYIYVPSTMVDTYKTATGWSTYASQIYAIGGTEWTTEFGSSFEYADYLYYNVELPDLNVGKSDDDYMEFLDDNVKSICATNWGDGENITVAQANTATITNTTFKGNTDIENFAEFKEFVGIGNILPAAAFMGCTNLKYISLPDNILYMQNQVNIGGWIVGSAFKDCTNLVGVNLNNYIGNDPSSTNGGKLFEGCTNLRYVDYTKVKYTQGSDDFLGCYSLQYLFAPNLEGTTSLSCGDCYNLEVLDYGSKVTKLSGRPRNLNYNHYPTPTDVTIKKCNIVFRSITPPECGDSNTWYGYAFTNGHGVLETSIIFVPKDSLTAYKEATTWTNVASIIYEIGGDEWVFTFGSSDEYADYTYYGVTPPTE